MEQAPFLILCLWLVCVALIYSTFIIISFSKIFFFVGRKLPAQMFKCIFSPETFLIRTPPLDEILKKLPVPLNTLYYHRFLPSLFIWLFSEVGSFNQKIIKLLKLVSWEPTWFIGYIFKKGIYSVDFRGKECSLKITLPVSTHIRDVLLLITLALTLDFFTFDDISIPCILLMDISIMSFD